MVAEQHYDNDALLNLLRNRMTGDIHAAELHIESCELCQNRLETVACSGMTWDEVSGLLKPDAETTKYRATIDHPERHWEQSAGKLLHPSKHPNSLGRFGRYEIMEVLGRGGMGIVMRGYDKALNRHSAIKVLTPELASSAAARKRFSREAKSAAAVVHPHVVPIQTVDEFEGLPYLVMPVVEGRSVDSRVQHSGPMTIIETVRIAAQVAEGLSAAHEKGLVHRDIKPANVLLENEVERVQITDFGLARAIDDASMTRSGVISGTPQYMSPEQARGESIDHRSDLFSLGSLMYFMLTGRSPFRAETTMGILHRICNDAPRPLRSINPDVPEWLEQIVTRLLTKSTHDRFQTANEVAELLEGCLAHAQDPSGSKLPAEIAHRNDGKQPPRILLIAAGAVFLFAFIAIALVEFNKGTIQIESDLDGVPIRILQGDRVVQELTVSLKGQSTRVAAGTYVVEIDTKFDGAQITNGTCVLSRGETETIRIAYIEPAEKLIPKNAIKQTRLRVKGRVSQEAETDGNKLGAATAQISHVLFTEFDIIDIQLRESESLQTDRRYLTFKLSDAAWLRCLKLQSQQPWVQVAVEFDGAPVEEPQFYRSNPTLPADLTSLRDFEKETAQQIVSRVWEVSRTKQTDTNDRQPTSDFTSKRQFFVQIQGAWKAAPNSKDRQPSNSAKYSSTEIRGSSFYLGKGEGLQHYEMKDFDFTKTPHHVTFSTHDGKRKRDYKGLIQFEAGILSMAICISPDANRPVAFTSDSSTCVFHWQRASNEPEALATTTRNSKLTEDMPEGLTHQPLFPNDEETANTDLDRLNAEYSTISKAYEAAATSAKDDTELNRVYEEMDPREIMPAKYLAFEAKYRGTKAGLQALTKTVELARSAGSLESAAARGQFIALQRILEHYIGHQGLENAIQNFAGCHISPQVDAFLGTVVDRSPYPKTQATALLVQIRRGYLMLQAKTQLPAILAAYERTAASVWSEVADQIEILKELDADKLRTNLNQQLTKLASEYREVPLQTYGTGSIAARHLSHAINYVRIGEIAPDILATDIEDRPFQLSKMKGKITVLLFTQDHSSEYGEMYSGVRQLVAKYQQFPVQVVGIMSNNAQSNLEAAAKRGKLPWIVIPQKFNGPIQLDWGIDGYPTVYVVDAEGILHAPLHMPYYGDGGYDTTDVTAKIDELLQQNRPAKEVQSLDIQTSDLHSSFASAAHAKTVTKLERVMSALHQYHVEHGHFPTSQVKGIGSKHKFPHSWRIAILPFLGEQNLYDAYHFDEPWNSKHNLTLQAQMPDAFRSPLAAANSINTSWSGFTSLQTTPEKTVQRKQRTFFHRSNGTSMNDITDGTSNTIALVETTHEIPWTQPTDLVYSPDQPLPQIGGWFPNGFHVAFADGTADFLATYNSEPDLRMLLTVSDGVNVEPVLASRLVFREANADSNGTPVIEVSQPPILTEEDVTSIAFTSDSHSPQLQQLEFTLTREAGKRLFRETTRLSNLEPPGLIAVELDGKLLSAARVMTAISDKFVVTGVKVNQTYQTLRAIIRNQDDSNSD